MDVDKTINEDEHNKYLKNLKQMKDDKIISKNEYDESVDEKEVTMREYLLTIKIKR